MPSNFVRHLSSHQLGHSASLLSISLCRLPLLLSLALIRVLSVPLHVCLCYLCVPRWFLHKLKDTLEVLVRKGIADKMQRALDCTWRLHW